VWGAVGLGRWAVEGQLYMYTYIPIESNDTAGSLRHIPLVDLDNNLFLVAYKPKSNITLPPYLFLSLYSL